MPAFPYLGETDRFSFPDPREWDGDIIAIGGNLSPGMLLSAYEQGVFPWYNPEDPIIWQSPDPRFVIFPEKLHVSSSMRRIFKAGVFTVTFDSEFEAVIRGCSEARRSGQGGTWITGDIIQAYTELHYLGWAHSAEAWYNGELAGGCYGVLMGHAFFGESMFAKVSNASKAAFLSLAEKLFENGIAFIDCQVPTRHLASLGGEPMARKDFLVLLKENRVSRSEPEGFTLRAERRYSPGMR
jgi:leucyl/phenylalanyl-tRNA--protein transferase